MRKILQATGARDVQDLIEKVCDRYEANEARKLTTAAVVDRFLRMDLPGSRWTGLS